MLKEIYKLGELTVFKKSKELEMKSHNLKDLFWECTLTCNANCKHCGSSAEKKVYKGELTTEEAKNAFKQIATDMDAKKIFINVTGGEPLTRKDLTEVMEYATKELGFTWGMTTNGMLLNDENIQKLKNACLRTVSISIDGLEQTHDEFRGVEGSYKKIIANIKKLKECNFLNQIMVTTVFHKKNINELEELYRVMSTLPIDSWRLAIMDPIGRAQVNKELLLDASEIKYLLDFIKKHNREKLKLQYGCPSFLGLEYEKEVGRGYFYCRTGISVASILYNGDLFVCPNVPRIPKLIQGNIKTDNFKDIWENKYEIFRRLDRMKCDKCEKCKQWDFCVGGALHTWDFNENKQKQCVYDMIYNKKN